ncbi:Transposase IS116/IS110/IS902 family protein [Bacteroidales bacterium Barb4]|nr:Transposase IS116/IS110/IS902 family protein [Bacteroidales bacterium Barb4]
MICVFIQQEKVLKEEETANTTAVVSQALKTFLKGGGEDDRRNRRLHRLYGCTKILLLCRPFSYLSGSSIRSRNRVSQRADKSIKALLHMAALVVATRCKGKLHEYYERKVAEGKNEKSVLNAVRAKLVHPMFAVIRNNQDYQKDYVNALA